MAIWLTIQSGLIAAKDLLNVKFEPLPLVKHMVPTWLEYAAKEAVLAVIKTFVRTGTLR
jgi:hypothetical protein